MKTSGSRPAPTPRIIVENLTKRYTAGDVLCFENLCLEVYDKEILCIVGPSGCGKTTLLRIMDGLIPHDDGRVLIDEEEVHSPRGNVAMVFQHFGLFPWKTLKENIAYGLRLQKRPAAEIRQVVAKYVKLVGLEGFESSYPYQLSGGMQQRAGLARALSINPDILFMDEPFGAVDAQTREILQEEILRIWEEERKTMVFVTHSIDEAVLLGDRIIVLSPRPGKIKETLTVDLPRPRGISEVRGDQRALERRSALAVKVGFRRSSEKVRSTHLVRGAVRRRYPAGLSPKPYTSINSGISMGPDLWFLKGKLGCRERILR